VVVAVAALTVLIVSAPPVRARQVWLAWLCLLALLVSETHQIPISFKASATVSTAIIFAAILILGPVHTAWSTALGLGLAYVYLKRRWYNTIFNVAVYVLSIAVSSWIYGLGGLSTDSPFVGWSDVAFLALAATVYFVVNTGLVAVMISLRRERHLWQTWLSMTGPVAPEYLVLIVLGIVVAAVYRHAWWGVVLLAVPVFLVYRSLAVKRVT